MNSVSPIKAASADARFLAQTLAKARPGDTVTYESLSAAIGRDVRKTAYSALQTALRMALRAPIWCRLFHRTA